MRTVKMSNSGIQNATRTASRRLMIVMSSATALHLFRGETASAISAFVIFLLVSVVADARWKVVPIAARHVARA